MLQNGALVGVIYVGPSPSLAEVVAAEPDPLLVASAGVLGVGSSVIDLTLRNDEPLGRNVKICLKPTVPFSKDDACLGFINDAGRWECEDPCLKSTEAEGGLLCGTTRHFTSFAVLFGGVGGSGGTRCSSAAANPYFSGRAWSDMMVVALVAGVVVTLSLAAIALSTWRPVRTALYGAEGSRILTARLHSMQQLAGGSAAHGVDGEVDLRA